MDEPTKLRPNEVRYLSFEGGGGKGAAYLGALAALAHDEIGLLEYDEGTDDYYLKRATGEAGSGIRGLAGASAGAITASLVASGWGVRGLYRDVISDRESLAGFFDPAALTSRKVPVALPKRVRGPGTNHFTRTSCLVERDDSLRWIYEDTVWGRLYRRLRRELKSKVTVADLLYRLWSGGPVERPHDPAAAQLWENTEAHLRDLVVDYGLFSGCAARDFLDLTIRNGRFVAPIDAESSEAARIRGSGDSLRNLTFAEHRRLTGIDLVLTGTNLRTGRGAYLSNRHGLTDMKVADAARISMGLPFAFKPVRIGTPRGGPGWGDEYDGLWVDGGVLNNNPIHAFDRDGTIDPHVLGLRLEEDKTNDIESLGDYLAAFMNTYLNAAETREIRSPQEEAQTITLPVPEGTLSLLNFTPDEDALWTAGIEAATAVLDYFEVDARPEPLLQNVLRISAPSQ